MDTYRYNCVDKSILLPYFKKGYVSLFFKFVPRWLTANFITIISTSLIFLSFAVTIFHGDLSSVIMAAIYAFSLHGYIVGDHLDGMQAKHTGTGSPLGEFLDHYLDIYNGTVILFMITVFFKPIADEVFYLFLLLNCLAFAATMMEELERKELYFGRVGSLEGVVVLILFFISWLFAPAREFWSRPIVMGYPLYWLIIAMFGVGYAATVVSIIHRLGYIPRQFALFAITLSGLILLYYTMEGDRLIGWLTITLYSGDYIASVMESYLLSREHKYPDPIISACLLLAGAAFLFDVASAAVLLWPLLFMMIYLSVKTPTTAGLVVYQLRSHWHWVNPSSPARHG